MRVLWLCNIMLPAVAKQLGVEASNKEGWLSGLAETVLENGGQSGIELAVAAPMPENLTGSGEEILSGEVKREGKAALKFYGFYEKMTCPEKYDAALEGRMQKILADFKPDLVHCFGTEYPHTLAMGRVFQPGERLLISIQGVCTAIAGAYYANLPEKVIRSATLRDVLKRDSLKKQREKFVLRGKQERAALELAGTIAGRTKLDEFYAKHWNPKARYVTLHETLRPEFYEGVWSEENCIPHSIFVSQGDYPLKGLHYMLEALPLIEKQYPDVKLYVAGNSLLRQGSLLNRMKISAYGKYLQQLICREKLEEKVIFPGRLSGEQMKEQYLKSNLFVCCSAMENSPNSLGEAMLLGVPCISADVGGVSSVFEGGKDGFLYEGFKTPENEFDNECDFYKTTEEFGKIIAKSIADDTIKMWSDAEKRKQFCENARNHARNNHDKERNYREMQEIYAEMSRYI